MAVLDQPCPVQDVADEVKEGQEQLCIEKILIGNIPKFDLYNPVLELRDNLTKAEGLQPGDAS